MLKTGLRGCVLLLFLGVKLLAVAQYQSDDWYLSPKISFADYSDRNDWDGYSIAKVPPISLTLETGLNDFFSAGALIGLSNDKYTNDTLSTNIHRYTTFALGGLATMHFAGWIEKWSNYSIFLGDWDFYVTGGAMLEWVGRKEEDVWSDEQQKLEDKKDTELNLRIRPTVGVRYFVTDNFCMLLELGKANMGMVTTGVTWRM